MEPGERHGRYEIVRLLGEGGMGRVYEALLHGPGGFRKRVALKVLHQGGAGLIREARLGGLLQHQNLVEVYALEQIDHTWVCAMELIEGGSISAHIPLPSSAVVDAAVQVCAGLTHAHAQIGLIHLDLKPDNVLVDAHGLVKVADLGIARARGLGANPLLLGTPAYMAPEQAQGDALDARADVFSLGVLLVAMATGMHGRDPRRVPRLESVLERCLAEDREERFRSVREVGEALLALELEGPTLAEAIHGKRGAPRSTYPSMGAPTMRADTFHIQPADPPSTNLGEEPDAFVGREDEARDLLALLAQPGLVTVKGFGGLGKTRLARHALRKWRDATGAAAWFCDLSAARTEPEVVQVVATTFEVPLTEAGDRAAEQVGHAIRSRGPIAVVLDNFEQVVHAAAVVDHWRRLAPEARWLVTSREPLKLAGEQVLELGPLAVEHGRALLRLRAEGLGIALTEDADLDELVCRLDGIPLALELAAGRLGLMGPAEILARLDQRFRLLRGGRRDVGARQATLRGTLDWSWDLLDPDERAALAQLSVFEGGCTIESAEAVLALPGDRWALDAIETLADRSLIHFRSGRLHLYETVRAYSSEKLANPAPVEARHGEHYAQLGDGPFLESLHGRQGDAQWEALLAERANLVAATRRAVARTDARAGERCAAAVWEIFGRQGPLGPGLELLESVEALEEHDVRGRARMHAMLGAASRTADRPEAALAHLQAARAIYAPGGGAPDRRREGRMLLMMSSLHEHARRLDGARDNVLEALAIARETGDRRAGAQGQAALSTIHRFSGQLDEALAAGRVALSALRAVGDQRSQARTLSNLGHIYDALGRWEESRAHMEAALQLARTLKDRRMEGLVLGHLATSADTRGEPSLPMHAASVKLAREVGSRRSEGVALSNMALCHAREGQIDEAVVHFHRAVEALRDAHIPRWEGFAWGNLGHTLLSVDRYDEAEVALEKATEIAVSVGDDFGEGCWRAGLGSLFSERGSHDQARAELDRAMGLLDAGGHRHQLAKVALIAVGAAEKRGDRDAARQAVAVVRDFLDSVQPGVDKALEDGFAALDPALVHRRTPGSMP